MKAYFQNLDSRSQKALIGLGTFLCVIAVYLGVIQPSWNYYIAGKQAVEENQALLSWMEANADRVSSNEVQTNPAPNLLQTLTTTAAEYGIQISRYQPQDQTKVRLWLNETNYVQAMQWLQELQQNYQVSVDSMTIDSTAKSGLVNIQCTLG